MQAIGEWGATWSFTEPRPEELDPDVLIVWMARHVDRQRLPHNRTVVQFDFRDPKRRYWMVLEPSEVSVCLQQPGFDVDLQVIVDTATLYLVYLGRAELGGAIRAGQLTMSGPRTLHADSATGSPGAHSPQPAARRRNAAQPPHALPALTAYGSPNSGIRALHHSGRNRHACSRTRSDERPSPGHAGDLAVARDGAQDAFGFSRS